VYLVSVFVEVFHPIESAWLHAAPIQQKASDPAKNSLSAIKLEIARNLPTSEYHSSILKLGLKPLRKDNWGDPPFQKYLSRYGYVNQPEECADRAYCQTYLHRHFVYRIPIWHYLHEFPEMWERIEECW